MNHNKCIHCGREFSIIRCSKCDLSIITCNINDTTCFTCKDKYLCTRPYCYIRCQMECITCNLPVCGKHESDLFMRGAKTNKLNERILICSACKIYQIDAEESYELVVAAISAYQKHTLKEIKFGFTKALEKYNVHDKLFVKHLVTLQAKLLHMNPDNIKL